MFTRRLSRGDRKKNEFIALVWVSYCQYLNRLQMYRQGISVEQCNVYFTVIGQAFHELWQFETRHVNARNLHMVLISSVSKLPCEQVQRCTWAVPYVLLSTEKFLIPSQIILTCLQDCFNSMVSNIFFNHQKNDYMHV